MKHMEVNDPLECDFVIAADRVVPQADQARTCPQCKRFTWAHTDACIWCGHDAAGRALRWVVAGLCIALTAVLFTSVLGIT